MKVQKEIIESLAMICASLPSSCFLREGNSYLPNYYTTYEKAEKHSVTEKVKQNMNMN